MNSNDATSRTDWRPMHGLILLGLTIVTSFVPIFRIWPLLWLVPLVGYAALVAVVPPLRSSFRRWRCGRASIATVSAAAIIATGSCAVLVAFHCLTRPDISAYGSFLPVSALGGILVVGVLFSVFNALFEEIIFRGVLFDAIESQWGVWGAVVATAVVFGYGHMRGYPPGPLGAALAGIYGLCLGGLRVFSGGLGLPVIARVTADATIFTIVARSGIF